MKERFNVLAEHLQTDDVERFRLTNLTRDEFGFAHLKHQQYFNGVKVQGGEYTVHIKNRQVVSISGDYVDMENQSRRYKLSGDEALKSALNHVNASRYRFPLSPEPLISRDVISADNVLKTPIGSRIAISVG